MAKPHHWKMAQPCRDCPFNSRGPGLHLRRSLRPGRWIIILNGLRKGEHFLCHETTHETGNGSNLICAGAMAWQDKRGLSSNLQRVMERVDAIWSGKGPKFERSPR